MILFLEISGFTVKDGNYPVRNVFRYTVMRIGLDEVAYLRFEAYVLVVDDDIIHVIPCIVC